MPVFGTQSSINATGYGFGGGASAETISTTVTPDNLSEGTQITITVNTQGIADGTTLYYSIRGTLGSITASDFTDNTLTGSFTVNNNSGSFNKTVANDGVVEDGEAFVIEIREDSSSGTILDTSSSVYVQGAQTSGVGEIINPDGTTSFHDFNTDGNLVIEPDGTGISSSSYTASTSVKLTAFIWGQAGGSEYGGLGGYSYGTFNLNQGDTLHMVLNYGGGPSRTGGGTGQDLGEDGGGLAGIFSSSDITQTNALLIAGGGGGGAPPVSNSGDATGGNGGGPSGGTGGDSPDTEINSVGGTGGTQTAGGTNAGYVEVSVSQNYTQNTTISIPDGVETVDYTIHGGKGGQGGPMSTRVNTSGGVGAQGQKVTGTLTNVSGTTLTLTMGGNGTQGSTVIGGSPGSGYVTGGVGGYNYSTPSDGFVGGAGGGGGGASAISIPSSNTLLALAGGGGGGAPIGYNASYTEEGNTSTTISNTGTASNGQNGSNSGASFNGAGGGGGGGVPGGNGGTADISGNDASGEGGDGGGGYYNSSYHDAAATLETPDSNNSYIEISYTTGGNTASPGSALQGGRGGTDPNSSGDFVAGGGGGGGYYGGAGGGSGNNLGQGARSASGGGGGSGYVASSVINGFTGGFSDGQNNPERGNAGSLGYSSRIVLQGSAIFEYEGISGQNNTYTLNVPGTATSMTAKLWGAGGTGTGECPPNGTGLQANQFSGGSGGHVEGTLAVTSGSQVVLWIGGAGSGSQPSDAYGSGAGRGGGFVGIVYGGSNLMIAGGGGGAGQAGNGGYGGGNGSGGGGVGGYGAPRAGGGGTQSSGGSAGPTSGNTWSSSAGRYFSSSGYNAFWRNNGGAGGGSGQFQGKRGGGGGAGYYGGGGAGGDENTNCSGGGGGGGSGIITGSWTNTVSQNGQSGTTGGRSATDTGDEHYITGYGGSGESGLAVIIFE